MCRAAARGRRRAASSVRRLFSVFSACSTSCLPTRCSCCRTRTRPSSRSTSSQRRPVASPSRRPHASATENSAPRRCCAGGRQERRRLVDVERHDRPRVGFGTFTSFAALIDDELQPLRVRERGPQRRMGQRDPAPGAVRRLVLRQPALHQPAASAVRARSVPNAGTERTRRSRGDTRGACSGATCRCSWRTTPRDRSRRSACWSSAAARQRHGRPACFNSTASACVDA